jgi:2,3-bisphosphoglycerate-dependent phosphoglycerate mutase
MAWNRLKGFWIDVVIPKVLAGNNVLVVAHGNIIRAMRRHVESLTDEEVLAKPIIANGFPLVYHFQDGIFVGHEVLGDQQERKIRQSNQVI